MVAAARRAALGLVADGARLAAFGGGVSICGLAYFLVWGVLAAADRIDLAARRGQGRIGPALAAALVLAAAATGLRVWDVGEHARDSDAMRTLQVASALGSLCLWMLAVLAASKAARAGERRWGRLAAPRTALALAVVVLSLGVLALGHLRHPDALARRELLRGHDVLVGRVAVGDE